MNGAEPAHTGWAVVCYRQVAVIPLGSQCEKTVSDFVSKLSALIPEAYYDLLARVASGVSFVALLVAYERTHQSPNALGISDWSTGVGFLIVAGYLTGLALTPLGILFSAPGVFGWKMYRRFAASEPLNLLQLPELSKRNDEVDRANPKAGATLFKMQAEQTLCSTLAAAYFILLCFMPGAIPFVEGTCSRVVVGIILAISASWRAATYYGRQARLHEIYVLTGAAPAP